LALCALHHKLFDRGAFSLSNDLKVEVSSRVNGTGGLIECLVQFNAIAIAVPISIAPNRIWASSAGTVKRFFINRSGIGPP
jgi:hypothetical protein